MDELLKDLGLDSLEELLVYMEENPGEQIVIELKEALGMIDSIKGDDKE